MVYLTSADRTRIGTVARVKNLRQIAASITEATICYKTEKGSKQTKVRFTGEMYQKSKALVEDEPVAIYMQYNTQDKNVYAINFAKEGSYFTTEGEETVIFAKPIKGNNSVRFILDKANFPYQEVALSASIDTEKVALIVAKNAQMRMTPKGKSLLYYSECLNFGQFVIKPNLTDVMITIGVYENRPIKASQLLNVPDEKRSQVLEWMAFAADSWNPPDIGNLRLQKQAIAEMLRLEKAMAR